MTPSFEDAGRIAQEWLDTGLDSLSAVSKDARAITLEASDYAKRFLGAGGETLGRLMSAKSIDKIVEIQTGYLRQSYESFVAETTVLGSLYADMARDAYRPFEAVVAKAK